MPSIQKGSNDIPPAVLKNCTYYKGERKNKDTDVTIIVGCDQLLLMRFHEKKHGPKNHNTPSIITPQVQIDLRTDIMKVLKRGGFEANRSGGSNGLWKGSTDSFFQFLRHPGNIPVKANVRTIYFAINVPNHFSPKSN